MTCSAGDPVGATLLRARRQGERFYDWASVTVTLPDEPPADGFTHTLMIRRSVADPSEVAYFLAHAPTRHRDEHDGRGRRDPLAH